jgi:hypothetical protein
MIVDCENKKQQKKLARPVFKAQPQNTKKMKTRKETILALRLSYFGLSAFTFQL